MQSPCKRQNSARVADEAPFALQALTAERLIRTQEVACATQAWGSSLDR